MTGPALSCALLCYNESESLGPGVEALERVCGSLGVKSWEAVVIDDGSTDATAVAIEALQARGLPVRWVRHERNLGYGQAMRTALSECRGEWFFLTDGDRQFYEEDLATLWSLAGQGAFDFIQGFRENRADPIHRKLIGAAYRRVVEKTFRLPIRDPECAFRLVRREFCLGLDAWRCEADLVPVEWVLKARAAGARFCEVGVRHRDREHGVSKAIGLRELRRLVPEFLTLASARPVSKSLEE